MDDFESEALRELCEEKGVKYQDALDLLELYDSQNDEESILAQIATYPDNARELITIILAPFLPVETHPS